MSNEPTIIEKFQNYMRYELNRSPQTVASYGRDLDAFESYFKNRDTHLSWESVDSDIIRDWMESMMDKGNNATSVCRRLSALRSLYRFAIKRGILPRDPSYSITAPRKKKPLPHFMREDEMARLLEQIPWGDTYRDVRARTILTVFYETGIRLAELIGLNDSSIDWAGSQLKVLGKGNRQRVIPFGEGLKRVLQDYMQRRDADVPRQSEALFLTDKGFRMKAYVVRQEVRQNLEKVSTQEKLTPHVLRHTFATSMLNGGAGLESVKKLLGHKKLSTTEIYTHTTFEQLKKVYKHAHPRA